MKHKRLIIILLSIVVLLLLPLIAMQFTEEVNWSLFDFLVAGGLLLGTGLLCELIMRRVKKLEHRRMIIIVLLILFLLIWAELAVGIFGTPFAGN